MMHFARLAGLQHQADPRARAGADQMMMQPGDASSAGIGAWRSVNAFIGQNQDRRAVGDRLIRRFE